MRLLLLFLLSLPLHAVIITVKTTGGDHPATEQGLRDALADPLLTCGSELQIEAGVTFTITSGNTSFTFNKDCAPGNEVTITTTKKAWLPDHDTRVTPSYGPLMPTLYLPRNINTGTAIPVMNVSTNIAPVKGIIIRGIAFKNDPFDYNRGDVSYSSFMLNLGQDGECDILTKYASNLTAEHLLFLSSDYTYPGSVGGAISLSGRSMRYLNSWLDDSRSWQMGAPEAWGLLSRNGGNDYQIRNNHFGTALTEHIMMGVGGPFCQTATEVPTDLTIEHNHFYNSIKWFPPGDNATQGAFMKNFVECKSCDTLKLRWNQGENQWAGNGGGQWHALVLTPRLSRDQAGCYAADSTGVGGAKLSDTKDVPSARAWPIPHPLRAVLSAGGATVTISYLHTDGSYHGCTVAAGPDHCTYVYPPGWAVGGGISVNHVPNPQCPYNNTVGVGCTVAQQNWDLSVIATVTDQFHFTVSPPLPSTADMGHGPGVGLFWEISQVFNRTANVFAMGNFWKSVATDTNFAFRDTTCGGSDSPTIGTTGQNVQYVHNLHADVEPEFYNCCGLVSTSLVHADLHNTANYYGDNVDISHNTRTSNSNAGAHISAADRASKQLWWDDFGRMYNYSNLTYRDTEPGTGGGFSGLKYNNNLVLPSTGGMAPADWQLRASDSVASQYLYIPANGFYMYPSNYAACPYGNRQCKNPDTFFDYPNLAVNIGFRDDKKNGFDVLPASIFHNAGSDAKDTGADTRNVTAIQDLTITPTDVAAWFRFKLTGPICHLPAQIEVSANSTLTSDLGTYTVVNAVNPTMFMRSDSDRVNPRATPSGCARMFMVGENVSVTDDNSVSRDLRLTPSTTYYYRLSVGGSQERGQFTTKAPVTPPASWVVSTATTTTHMKVQSGPNVASLVTGATTPCGPAGCSFTLSPDANSRQMVYFILGCDSAGVVSNTWGPYFQMVK